MPNLAIPETQSLVPQADVSAGNGGPGTGQIVAGLEAAGADAAHIYERRQYDAGLLQATNALSAMQLKLQQNRAAAAAVVPNAVADLNASDDPIGNIDTYTNARAQRDQMLSPTAVGQSIDSMADEAAKNINGPGRVIFMQRVAELRGQAMVQAGQQQEADQQQAIATGVDSATNIAAQVVAQDHNQYPQQLAQLGATIQSLSLPPAVVADKMQRARSALASSAADGLVARYPAAALEGLNRYFGVSAPTPNQPPTQPDQPGSAPASAGGPEWTAANQAAAAAKVDPSRIPTLQAEIDNPATTDASRAALQGQIDQIRQASAAPPAAPSSQTTLTADDAARALDDRGGQPGNASLPFLNALTPIQALEFRNRALEAVQRGQATQRVALEAQTKDYQAMVLAGVVPPAESTPTAEGYVAAYGAAGAQRYQSEVATYTQLASGLAQLQSASYTDRHAVIARYTPTPGPGFDDQQKIQSTLAQANALIEKKLAADPAAYAAQTSPQVQQASASMQSTLADPTTTPAQRAAAVDAYALATTAEQQRLGISQLKSDVLGESATPRQLTPRLLTNGQANAIAEQFHTGSANAADVMGGLQAQWGSHFNDVFAQLTQDEKLPPAAMVIPNMSDPYAKETLARYSDPKVQKDMVENLPAGATKDINTSLQQLNEPFFNTLAFQQGGQRTFDTVLEQQRTLAGAYVMQGRSASDAARIAYEQTVGHQYVFVDSLRIPKAEQPDLVQSGLGTLQESPQTLNATPPASYRPGLTPQARNAAWLDAIKSNAAWVANGDESGATLVVRGRTDTGADVRYPVPGPDGKTPMSWTWSKLRAIGMDRNAKVRALRQSADLQTDVQPSVSAGGF